MTNPSIVCWVPESNDSNIYELSLLETYDDSPEGEKLYNNDLADLMIKLNLEKYFPAHDLPGPPPPTTKIDEWTVHLPYNAVMDPKNYFKKQALTGLSILYKIERQTSETLDDYLIRTNNIVKSRGLISAARDFPDPILPNDPLLIATRDCCDLSMEGVVMEQTDPDIAGLDRGNRHRPYSRTDQNSSASASLMEASTYLHFANISKVPVMQILGMIEMTVDEDEDIDDDDAESANPNASSL